MAPEAASLIPGEMQGHPCRGISDHARCGRLALEVAEVLALSVWIFDSPDDAPQALDRVVEAAQRAGAKVPETAYVRWPAAGRHPEIRVHDDPTHELLEHSFWAVVLGLVFSVPLLDAALARPASGVSTALVADLGVGETMTNRIRDRVVPGTSACFALVPAADLPGLESEIEDLRSLRLTSEITVACEGDSGILELFCSPEGHMSE